MDHNDELDFEHRLTAVEKLGKGNQRRIERLEKQQETIHELTASIKVMVAEQKHQTEAINETRRDVAKLDSKVDALEAKPGKRWETIITEALKLLVAVFFGYLAAKMGLHI